MILETAVLKIRAGESANFEAAFAEAQQILRQAVGYISHELRRCVELEDQYVLLVQWRTLEDHTIGFRGSAHYQRWKEMLHHFYDPFPMVHHYRPVVLS
jgi:heme-degrading monooxygenase HmoA